MFAKHPPFSGSTESRLLEAAGEIFAEYGYRATTVRQICEKAKANVAAVNYHFGDKDGLYLAVLRHLHKVRDEKNPTNPGLSSKASREEKLRAFISAILHRMLDRDSPDWYMKLMVREMIEPTRALDVMVEEEQWLAKIDGRPPRDRATLSRLIDPSLLREARAR